jgi:hypothetical protein
MQVEPIQQEIEPMQQEIEPIQQEKEPIQQEKEPIQQEKEPMQQEKEVKENISLVISEIEVVKALEEEPIQQVIEQLISEIEKNKKEEEMVRIIELRKKYNMYSNISIIDDKKLPSLDISLSDAMLEINAMKLEPFNVYIERWTTLHNKKHKVSNKKSDEPIINDLLLPELTLSFPIALSKIKANPKCKPEELYIKRWNELKTLKMYKRDKK